MSHVIELTSQTRLNPQETTTANPEYAEIDLSTNETLLCRLEHLSDGRCLTTFGFAFTGLVGPSRTGHETIRPDMSHPRESPREMDHLGATLQVLEPDQTLEVVFSADPGSSSPTWDLRGHSTGHDSRQALRSARILGANLASLVESYRDQFKFEPINAASSLIAGAAAARYQFRVQPLGGRTPGRLGRQAGFVCAAAKREHLSVILPFLPRRGSVSLDSLLSLPSLQGRSTAAISITRCRLSNEHVDALWQALECLQRTRPAESFSEVAERPATLPFADQEWTGNLLRTWASVPSGYRIRLTVESDHKISEATLKLLGAELFGLPSQAIGVQQSGPTGPVSEGRFRGSARIAGQGSLDLANCVHELETTPSLFPSPSALRRGGARRWFPVLPGPQDSDQGLALGALERGGVVRLPSSQRARHCYLLGATGTGKSTLLFNMIRQDIESGEGVCLIDPHGDLYDQVMCSIPERRWRDVVLLDATDETHCPGVNLLERSTNRRLQAVEMSFITNEMVQIFDRLYDLKITGGPIFEQYMRNALLLAMDNEYADATLVDVPLVFESSEFRSFLKKGCRNAIVRSFWSRQAEQAHGEVSLSNIAPYITSKLNQFTSNALIRPIIGQVKSTVDFRRVMDKRRILLVNLAKGVLGGLDTQLLGMLIIGKLFTAAMGRGSAKTRTPFYVYIDEFQNFTTDTVAHLLSEARKFGLHLTLANQNLAQLRDSGSKRSILDAVLGNCGTLLMFRLGCLDAERMAAYTKPELNEQDLQDLPNFHVTARLLAGDYPSRPFVFRTEKPREKDSGRLLSRIVRESKRRDARRRDEVEAEIAARYNPFLNL